jgi:hypothetical protein
MSLSVKSWLPHAVAVIVFLEAGMHAAVKTSTGSGNWANNNTWNSAGVPQCGDSVVILAGHLITVNSNQNYLCGTRMAVVVQGTMSFASMSKLRLPCNSSFYVFPGGVVVSPTAGQNDRIEICGTDYWDGSMGPLTGPACLPPGACFNVLPVKLAEFNGFDCGDSGNCFSWSTLSESGCNHFELQRAVESTIFSTIRIIPSSSADGDSHQKLTYAAVDDAPAGELCYYRLRMVEKAGGEDYSEVTAVARRTGSGVRFSIAYLPEHSIQLRATGLRRGEVLKIRLLDPLGSEQAGLSVTVSATEVLTELNTAASPSGIGVCSVETAGITKHLKVLFE